MERQQCSSATRDTEPRCSSRDRDDQPPPIAASVTAAAAAVAAEGSLAAAAAVAAATAATGNGKATWSYPGIDLMATGAFWQNYSGEFQYTLNLSC